MGFGTVDYTKLNRATSALAQGIKQEQEVEMFGMKVLRERADRENAQQVRQFVTKALEPEVTTEPGKAITAPSWPGGGPKQVGTTKGKASLRFKSPMEMLQVMQQAGEMLSRTGGEHSERAAKDITSYLTARIKMEPKPDTSVTLEDDLRTGRITEDQYMKLKHGDKTGKETKPGFEFYDDPRDNTRYRIVRHPTTGEEIRRIRVGPVPLGAGAGGVGKSIEGLTERGPEGKLRLKTSEQGIPVGITQDKLQQIRAQLEDDYSRGLRYMSQALETYNTYSADQKNYEALLKSQPDNEMMKTVLEGVGKQAKDAYDDYLRWKDELDRNVSPLLEDVRTYNPKQARPKPGAQTGSAFDYYRNKGKKK